MLNGGPENCLKDVRPAVGVDEAEPLIVVWEVCLARIFSNPSACDFSVNIPNSPPVRYANWPFPPRELKNGGPGGQMDQKRFAEEQIVRYGGLFPVTAVGRNRTVVTLDEIAVFRDLKLRIDSISTSSGGIEDITKHSE